MSISKVGLGRSTLRWSEAASAALPTPLSQPRIVAETALGSVDVGDGFTKREGAFY
jgi:hypothetical protein